MLLSCFHLVIQLWQNEIESNENSILYDEEIRYSPCTPAIAISHVSHNWRQLVINTPFLWTYITAMPLHKDRTDVHEDILRRIGNMPFALDFRYRGKPPPVMNDSDDESLLTPGSGPPTPRAYQMYGRSPVNSNELAQLLLRKIGLSIMKPSLPASFDHLTSLSVLHVDVVQDDRLDYELWQQLLASAPCLRSLQISSDAISNRALSSIVTEIRLPNLENLTTVDWNSGLLHFFCFPVCSRASTA
ncbi:hypothetical protein BJ138DRAFT_509184 [Hygrophoropsis aurantiaca]|uniref:Uncharacterized protein n=1 Tax=Hygrophoropsis aurantiaca TaxID=72124 RepID=A0ACB8A239_9AGAM|nr:hypothetical protein BJ138DRAFT_509184 [Hygrophoropsis aurantiaca]